MAINNQVEAKVKLSAVKEYLGGNGSLNKIAEKYGVRRSTLQKWLLNYELFGEVGLQHRLYYDPKWDGLLDQIDWTGDQNGILMSFTGAAYATGAIDSIGLPPTVEMDGANGLKVGGMTEDGSGYDMSKSFSFGFAPLMAATWDTKRIYEVGAAFGQEFLQSGINGWYCPPSTCTVPRSTAASLSTTPRTWCCPASWPPPPFPARGTRGCSAT